MTTTTTTNYDDNNDDNTRVGGVWAHKIPNASAKILSIGCKNSYASFT